MFEPVFQEFGLAKNEAIIYEICLKEGETSVADISRKSKIHRRNVYDSLKRLIEKGLIFEIITPRENLYQAVDPNKFLEFVREKENMLTRVMPKLQSMYHSTSHSNEVYVYRGPEGWKNYMRDMVRVGEPAYFIGAKGAWLDERVKYFYPQFEKEFKKKKMKFYHLFDAEVEDQFPEIVSRVGKNYRFLPPQYSTETAIDIFGDHVNIISDIHLGKLGDDFSFTVLVNPQIANAFRIWFQMMWDFCPKK